MKVPAYKLLKKVVKEREVCLLELYEMLPKKFGDYRDLMPLAFLCSEGYLQHGWSSSNGKEHTNSYLLASIFYAKATGIKKVNKYTNGSGKSAKGQTVFISTSKAELYFADLRSKRLERLISIGISITIGVCSATVAVMIKSKLSV